MNTQYNSAKCSSVIHMHMHGMLKFYAADIRYLCVRACMGRRGVSMTSDM